MSTTEITTKIEALRDLEELIEEATPAVPPTKRNRTSTAKCGN